MKTPTLHIPYIPNLDNLSLEEVANAIEDGGTRFSVESLNWPTQFPYRPLTVITAAHSNDYLYVEFLVRCNYLRAANYTDNSPVSEDSCVEVYIAPNANSDNYWTLEFNCIGTMNAAICSAAQKEYTKLTTEQLQSIKRYASVGTRPFQELEGSFIWTVAIAIPLSLFNLKYTGHPLEMRGNFNKCASATSQPHYLSWAPISTETPNFHQPEFFGKIILD